MDHHLALQPKLTRPPHHHLAEWKTMKMTPYS